MGHQSPTGSPSERTCAKMAFVVLFTFLVYTLCVDAQSICRAADNSAGRCVSIYQCEELLPLLKKPDRTPQEKDLMKKSHCGFEGKVPKVCCPEPCYTPEWQLGKCVKVQQCPHLAKRLQAPLTEENKQYVQKSRCEGPDEYSVCCGPPDPKPESDDDDDDSCVLTAAPPRPSTSCCGIDSNTGDKIIGGTETSIDQYPWLALIEYVNATIPGVLLMCGASLISGKYVLTAGHCVAGEILDIGTPKSVRLGEYDVSNPGKDCVVVAGGAPDCTKDPISYDIEKTIPHPQYDPYAYLRRNDIALIRLKKMVLYTDFIRPICLPTADATLSPPKDFIFYVAGWGAVETVDYRKSDIKLHVNVSYHDQESCQSIYRQRYKLQLWNKHMCAGGETHKDSCKGDSGGPLMFENKRFFEAIGVVSFGPKPCAKAGVPAVYTKVYDYVDWIRSVIKP